MAGRALRTGQAGAGHPRRRRPAAADRGTRHVTLRPLTPLLSSFIRYVPHRVEGMSPVSERSPDQASTTFVEVDGVRLRTRVRGSGSPVLLITGLRASPAPRATFGS